MANDKAIAWAAGLFEGEGCWVVHKVRQSEYIAASLSTTDLDVLERFQSIVGFGTIAALPRQARPFALDAIKPTYYKQRYHWQVHNALQTRQLIDMFWPYLGERRRRRARELRDISADIGSRGHSKYQTHCIHGHEFTEANTYRKSDGLRACRACNREKQKRCRERKSKL